MSSWRSYWKVRHVVTHNAASMVLVLVLRGGSVQVKKKMNLNQREKQVKKKMNLNQKENHMVKTRMITEIESTGRGKLTSRRRLRHLISISRILMFHSDIP